MSDIYFVPSQRQELRNILDFQLVVLRTATYLAGRPPSVATVFASSITNRSTLRYVVIAGREE